LSAVASNTEIQAVGLGEIFLARDTGTLVAYGLGSCVGVCIYDPGSKTAGMAHVMLPENTSKKEHAGMPGRYADSAIEILVEMMIAEGAVPGRMEVRIGGGAQMLSAPGLSDKFNIGSRNVESVKAELTRMQLTLKGEDTGGQSGRTLTMDAATGTVTVKSLGAPGPTTL
jgi:chemotaxis protein CheD